MNLLRTSSYTAASTIVGFLSGFISIKFVAIKIGPAGLAQFGQYQSITALLATVACVSISVGLTKYMASFGGEPQRQQRLFSTAVSTVIISSIITAVCVITISGWLSVKAFRNENYWPIFSLFGCLLVLTSLNTVCSSALNGLKQIKKLTILTISASLAGVVFTVVLAIAFDFTGILLALNCTALVLFIINLFFLKDIPGLSLRPAFKKFDRRLFILLISYSAVSLLTNSLIPVNQLFIRDFLIENLSIENAGFWQAMTRISDYYLLFVTTVLGVYFLPVLSELKDQTAIKKEISGGYRVILPVVAGLATVIYFLRFLIIRTLFTDAFAPMEQLFLFQMVGDFLKIGGWLLGYLMAARGKLKTIVVLEIVFTTSNILLTRFFVSNYGVTGTTYAFAVNYGLYWITTAIIMRRYIFTARQTAKMS